MTLGVVSLRCEERRHSREQDPPPPVHKARHSPEFALLSIAAAINRVADTPADRGEAVAARPAFRIDDIREDYPNAYARWSPADDATLPEAYANGQDVESLAIAFGRNEGAIRARLTRLMFPAQDG